MTDFYEILELDNKASQDDIKRSYKKLAMFLHPDRTTGNENKFKEVGRAYEVLSDNKKRAVYDRFGMDGINEMESDEASNHSAEQIYKSFFQEERQHNDILLSLQVSLLDLYQGATQTKTVERNMFCGTCDRTGVIGAMDLSPCIDCGGSGYKIELKQINGIFAQQVKVKCKTCEGRGKVIPKELICPDCNGYGKKAESVTHEVKIQPGSFSNDNIVIENGGHNNEGNLVFVIEEQPNEDFRRVDNNLLYKKEIKLADSLCGVNFILNFINNQPILIRSKVLINPSKVYKVIGYGMPIKDSDERGDLYIEFKVNFPKKMELKPEAKKQLRKILKLDDIDEEPDTEGLKTCTLLETDDDDMANSFHPNMDPKNRGFGNLPQAAASCAQQ